MNPTQATQLLERYRLVKSAYDPGTYETAAGLLHSLSTMPKAMPAVLGGGVGALIGGGGAALANRGKEEDERVNPLVAALLGGGAGAAVGHVGKEAFQSHLTKQMPELEQKAMASGLANSALGLSQKVQKLSTPLNTGAGAVLGGSAGGLLSHATKFGKKHPLLSVLSALAGGGAGGALGHAYGERKVTELQQSDQKIRDALGKL